MKITLRGPEDLTINDLDAPGFEVVSDNDKAVYSAIQMFAVSLGLCTYSVVLQYGEALGVDATGLTLRLRWRYADEPFRIAHLDVDIDWPAMPSDRLRAVQRVAAHCTLHNTLRHPPEVVTRVANADGRYHF